MGGGGDGSGLAGDDGERGGGEGSGGGGEGTGVACAGESGGNGGSGSAKVRAGAPLPCAKRICEEGSACASGWDAVTREEPRPAGQDALGTEGEAAVFERAARAALELQSERVREGCDTAISQVYFDGNGARFVACGNVAHDILIPRPPSRGACALECGTCVASATVGEVVEQIGRMRNHDTSGHVLLVLRPCRIALLEGLILKLWPQLATHHTAHPEVSPSSTLHGGPKEPSDVDAAVIRPIQR
eukprot:6546347-Prymnesium_polylepis.1